MNYIGEFCKTLCYFLQSSLYLFSGKDSSDNTHQTVCELMRRLSWKTLIILSDSQSQILDECSLNLGIIYQRHQICSNWPLVTTWDVCHPGWPYHVVLDVSQSCMLRILSQV